MHFRNIMHRWVVVLLCVVVIEVCHPKKKLKINGEQTILGSLEISGASFWGRGPKKLRQKFSGAQNWMRALFRD